MKMRYRSERVRSAGPVRMFEPSAPVPYHQPIGGSSNGRTGAFEALKLGPNPSPPAQSRSGSEIAEFSRAAATAA